LNALKTVALDDPSSSKTGVETSDLCIDLTPFLKDEQGEEVYVIETEDLSDVTSLVPKGKKKRIWAVKDGLLENDDFVFVSSDGWQKLLSW
jgi:hypothetical protein